MVRGQMWGDAPLAGRSAPVIEDFDTSPTSTDSGIQAGNEDAKARTTLYRSVGIVVGAVGLLWVFGGIVFKDATL